MKTTRKKAFLCFVLCILLPLIPLFLFLPNKPVFGYYIINNEGQAVASPTDLPSFLMSSSFPTWAKTLFMSCYCLAILAPVFGCFCFCFAPRQSKTSRNVLFVIWAVLNLVGGSFLAIQNGLSNSSFHGFLFACYCFFVPAFLIFVLLFCWGSENDRWFSWNFYSPIVAATFLVLAIGTPLNPMVIIGNGNSAATRYSEWGGLTGENPLWVQVFCWVLVVCSLLLVASLPFYSLFFIWGRKKINRVLFWSLLALFSLSFISYFSLSFYCAYVFLGLLGSWVLLLGAISLFTCKGYLTDY